ncbi:MAG TPA: hypothetical protein VHR47_02820 [Bacillota bacterium]|nr:hypothetical protein [Bacillota bacterium]
MLGSILGTNIGAYLYNEPPNPGQEGRAGSKRRGKRRHCPYIQTHGLLVVSELLSVMGELRKPPGSGDFFGYFFRR